MAEIKWIKLMTSMFEDEKIDYIESMPEADAVLIIWIKLLTLAGRCNATGFIFLTERIPYTVEMLAHKFKRPINTVRFALDILTRLDMIQMDSERLVITNWEKHQNEEGLEKIRKQTRIRVANYRERQRLLSENSNVTGNGGVTQGNAIDIEEDIDIDIKNIYSRESEVEEEKVSIPYQDIISYLNEKTGSRYRPSTPSTREKIRARWKEGFRLQDFQTVIDKKVAEWKGNDMEKFLRPETLFGTKFEGYLNQQTKIRELPTESEDELWAKYGVDR